MFSTATPTSPTCKMGPMGSPELEAELDTVREELAVSTELLASLPDQALAALPRDKLKSLLRIQDTATRQVAAETRLDRSELARMLLLEKGSRLARTALRVLLLAPHPTKDGPYKQALDGLEETIKTEWPQAYKRAWMAGASQPKKTP